MTHAPSERPRSEEASSSTPLRVFNTLESQAELLPHGEAYQKVRQLFLRPAGGIRWIQGLEGSGKTTLIRTVLEALDPPGPGVIRVDCSGGLRVEQALATIAEYLCQVGQPDFERILAQRSSLRSKIQILLEILKSRELVIWLDGFHELEGSSQRPDRSALKTFTECCSSWEPDRGVLLVTPDSAGPEGLTPDDLGAISLELDAGSIVDGELAWKHWASGLDPSEAGRIPDLEEIPVEHRHNLLTLELHFQNALHVGPDRPLRSARLEGLVRELRAGLSAAGRELLDLLTVHVQPMTRGALRGFATSLERPELIDEGLEELRRWRLVTRDGAPDGRLQIHPAIARGVARDLRRESPQTWSSLNQLVAHHHLEAARRSRSVWRLYESFVHQFVGGHYQEAYEIQKTFLESLLGQGYLELAKSVLEKCLETVESPAREIVAGNLAIVHKNEGDHAEAIRIYKESLLAFARRGDAANTARVYHQIGNTYYLQGENEKALESYRSCLEVAETLDDRSIALMARVQMANIQFARKEYESAYEVYGEALESAEDAGNHLMVAALSLQLGQIHLNRNEFSQADEILSKAETTARTEEDFRHLLKIQQVQGVVATRMHRDEDAIAKFEEARKLAHRLGDLTEAANCQIHLGAMLEKRHRYRESIHQLLQARQTVLRLLKIQAVSGESSNVSEVIDSINSRLEKLRETAGEAPYAEVLSEFKESRGEAEAGTED